MEYLLEMKNIQKSFYGTEVLGGVNFGVKKGEVHVLLGENGAGKSTLMKILSGAYTADGGQIILNGQPVTIKEPSHSLKLGIGMVYQELSVVPNMNVVENIWLGAMPHNKLSFINWRDAKRRTQQIFDDLNIAVDINKKVSGFDLGIQQLIEICRVTSQNAGLIILDEPTSSLTDVEVKKLFETIRMLKTKGVSFVYITHKLDEVFEIGDRVTVLRDGKTIGKTLDDFSVISQDDLVTMMVGRSLDEQYPKVASVKEELILQVENFSDGKSFFDVSFEVHRGEVLGVAGLVGSGRSELAKALFGLKKIKSGKIVYKGEEYVPKDAVSAIRKSIGLLTKDRKEGLLLHMSLAENISVVKKEGFSKYGFRLKPEEKKEAERFIGLLKIDSDSTSKKVRDLSGGNQQKVAIAKWYGNNTALYIMDDPTRGVDVGAKVEVYKLINQITAMGASVIMISSDMPELLGISDNIMVMKRGRIAALLNAKECTQEIILQKAAGSEKK